MIGEIPKRRRGRPTKTEAAARAKAEAAARSKAESAAAMAAFDPRATLAEIAGDRRAPAMARVAACKTLIDDAGAATKSDRDDLRERVANKAVELLANGRLN